MSSSDAQSIVDVTLTAAQPTELDPEQRYAFTLPDDGTVHVVEPKPDSDLPHPRRVSGTSVVLDVDGFAHLWKKHADGEVSEVFAERDNARIVALYNADGGIGGAAGHRDHRAVLQLKETPEWKAWTHLSGQMIPQTAFAEFLEEHHDDVFADGGNRISGLQMLELAQTFQQKSTVQFKSSEMLTSGERTLVYEEQAAAKAGQKGEITIPTEFVIAVSPYEGMERYKVTARFRHRIQNGVLALGFKLMRADDVLRNAFGDTVQKVHEACDTEVLLGSPPAARG